MASGLENVSKTYIMPCQLDFGIGKLYMYIYDYTGQRSKINGCICIILDPLNICRIQIARLGTILLYIGPQSIVQYIVILSL